MVKDGFKLGVFGGILIGTTGAIAMICGSAAAWFCEEVLPDALDGTREKVEKIKEKLKKED